MSHTAPVSYTHLAERATPALQKAIKKSDKAADRLDAARAAIPKQTKIKDVYKRQVVEGQHEPLIDRMSFDIVQNTLKSRQRPGQTNEISLFAGLLKCGECGKALTVRYTNAKHPQRIYSCKTYNAFGKNHCTQHRIDYDTLYSHVLRKIRECARAALMDGEAVADRLTNTCLLYTSLGHPEPCG